jgi:hypothetical protein
MCFYEPTDKQGNGEAVVYNYKVNGWTRFTGMNAVCSLSAGLTTGTVLADPSVKTSSYRLLLGGSNGVVYAWGEDSNDGIPPALTYSGNMTVTSFDSLTGACEVDGLTLSLAVDIVGLWLTFISPLYEYVTAPITSYDAATDTVYCDPLWFDDTPEEGWRVIIGQPPMLIEYPWDWISNAYLDKQLVEFVTWQSESFYYRYGVNFLDSYTGDRKFITQLTDGQRKRIQLNRRCEAIKFEFTSFDLDAEFNGFLVSYADSRGAGNQQ